MLKPLPVTEKLIRLAEFHPANLRKLFVAEEAGDIELELVKTDIIFADESDPVALVIEAKATHKSESGRITTKNCQRIIPLEVYLSSNNNKQ